MSFSPSSSSLTPEQIRSILQTLLDAPRSAAEMQASDWQTYQRLMEIYCVVQAGGVQVQIEAAQYSLNQQRQELLAQTQPDRPELLQQELSDLERATAWRIQQLQAIAPEEEAAVKVCFPEIEAFLTAWTTRQTVVTY